MFQGMHYVYEVYKEMSFSKAARNLFISQPSLSAAVKKAEAQKKTYKVTNLGNISFKWPCPSSGRITSGFGKRNSPTKGASTNHQGIDF